MVRPECLENEIKCWLDDIYPGEIDVIVAPEVHHEFKNPFEKPKITVIFALTKFEKQRDTSTVLQDEFNHVDIVIQSRYMRDKFGVYDLYEQIRRRVHSRTSKIAGDKYQTVAFVPDGDNLDENVWTYVYQVRVKSMVVESENEFEESPILQSVQYEGI